jgi:hypothetical protein
MRAHPHHAGCCVARGNGVLEDSAQASVGKGSLDEPCSATM